MTAEIDDASPPRTRRSCSRFSIGTSYEGREIVGDRRSPTTSAPTRPSPRCCSPCGQHAREHLTIEMCALPAQRADVEVRDRRARSRTSSNSREIWIVSNLNPDGGEYDIATGSYRSWRKNRQPNSGSTAVGTDLNRNWGFQWGCCGGSSGTFSSETYRGPSAFSAPETQRVRDFVNSRVVGGVQQIKAAHRLPHLLRADPVAVRLHDREHGARRSPPTTRRRFATLGRSMAAHQRLHARAGSDLYIADGTIDDWLWGAHKIFGYTFEMYPRTSSPGFYPPGSVIGARDDAATARPCCCCSRPPTARTEVDRQQAVRRGHAAGDGLQRQLRDRDRLDGERRRHRHRDDRPLASAPTRPATNSERRQAARHDDERRRSTS